MKINWLKIIGKTSLVLAEMGSKIAIFLFIIINMMSLLMFWLLISQGYIQTEANIQTEATYLVPKIKQIIFFTLLAIIYLYGKNIFKELIEDKR